MDALQQKTGRGNEVSIEDGNEFSLGSFQSLGERAGFEALAIIAVQANDGMSEGSIALNQNAGDFDGFIGRVIEQLDVELIFRIFKAADGVKQTVDYILLVVNRQLHGHARQGVLREIGNRIGRLVLFVLVIEIDHPIAVGAIRREDGQHDEVGNQQCQVEGVDLVKSLKSLVEKMLAQVGPQAFGGENHGYCQRGSGVQRHEVRRSMK